MSYSICKISFLFLFITCFACTSQKVDLIEAIRDGDLTLVQNLIKKGANVNCRDDTGHSPLHHACYYGHYDIIKHLVNNGADINNKVPHYNLTPLHGAAINGDLQIVEYLVEHGADINAKDNEGATPIMSACWIGEHSIVKYLFEKGAEITETTNYGASPLHFATQSGNLGLVIFLVNQGIDVNIISSNGSTPLHLSVAIGNKEIVEYLIVNNANTNVKMKDDFLFKRCLYAPILSDNDFTDIAIYKEQTPLDIAKDKDYKEIIELLRSVN